MTTERPDLGALLFRLARVVAERERPLLAEQGLDMWDYVVLSRLGAGEAGSQTRLAASSGRDKTRLIGNLDRLGELGLIERQPDPADRRHKIITITPAGRQVLAGCRRRIRAMERELLSELDAADRVGFRAALERLDEAAGPGSSD